MSKDLVVSAQPAAVAVGWWVDPQKVDLVKRTIAKGASNDELALFMVQCQRTGLDPFARQIYAIKRWNGVEKRYEMAVQTGIDGFRLIADRTGQYEGQLGPFWCGKDGLWKDVWLGDEPPHAAKVGVLRSGFKEPLWAVARYSSYVQTNREGNPNHFWSTMPDGQLAKCAESLALRKAFPQELSGLYTTEEMGDEAAQSVARKKITALQAQEQPTYVATESDVPPEVSPNPPPTPNKPWSRFSEMCTMFADLKEQLGDTAYYGILRSFGATHSNDFRKLGSDKAAECYRALGAALDELAQVAATEAEATQ